MNTLEKIFDVSAQNKALQANNYQQRLNDKWQLYLNGVEDIMNNLSFLSLRGYTITKDNVHEFDFNKAVNGYYPCVRLNSTTIITKSVSDCIGVSSLHLFALSGERHSYESFIKKLINNF